MSAPVCSYWVVYEAEQELEARLFSDPKLGELFPKRRVSFSEGELGWVARSKTSLRVDDVFSDERIVETDWWRESQLRSFYGVPVFIGDRLMGVIALNGTEPFSFDAAQERFKHDDPTTYLIDPISSSGRRGIYIIRSIYIVRIVACFQTTYMCLSIWLEAKCDQ